MKIGTNQKISKIETRVWLSPKEGLSIEEAIDKLNELGNKILEIDYENKRFLVSYNLHEVKNG